MLNRKIRSDSQDTNRILRFTLTLKSHFDFVIDHDTSTTWLIFHGIFILSLWKNKNEIRFIFEIQVKMRFKVTHFPISFGDEKIQFDSYESN